MNDNFIKFLAPLWPNLKTFFDEICIVWINLKLLDVVARNTNLAYLALNFTSIPIFR
jgi:hypothetical protein